jgi:hypothetical protein
LLGVEMIIDGISLSAASAIESEEQSVRHKYETTLEQ